jgi:hypothetical protein
MVDRLLVNFSNRILVNPDYGRIILSASTVFWPGPPSPVMGAKRTLNRHNSGKFIVNQMKGGI